MANEVLIERPSPAVVVVKLNRPEARNAVNGALTAGITAAIRLVESDPEVRVAVLGSTTDAVFCAGGDLKGGDPVESIITPEGGFGGIVQAPRTKPWIAAIAGKALGGGCELALACDMIVAGEKAEFGLPEVKIGVFAGAGGVIRIPQAVPRAIAMEMLTTGASISAQRAYDLGMVNRVVATEAVLDEAIAMAEAIGRCAPLSVRESFALGRVAASLSEEERWERSNAAMGRVLASADAAEGMRAFGEKRKPVWKGC